METLRRKRNRENLRVISKSVILRHYEITGHAFKNEKLICETVVLDRKGKYVLLQCGKNSPSIDNIADGITDSFYNEHNIDENEPVKVHNKKEAEEEWKRFVDKYFNLPCTYTTDWIGVYDLEKKEWVKKW